MKLGISSAILGELQQLVLEGAPDEFAGCCLVRTMLLQSINQRQILLTFPVIISKLIQPG